MNFNRQLDEARTLGKDMALAGFSIERNPFTHLNPALARAWVEGWSGVTRTENLRANLFNKKMDEVKRTVLRRVRS